MAAGIAGVPLLRLNKGAMQFIQHQESWWNQYNDCVDFSKRAQQSRRCFKLPVQTDNISVSVLMFQPFPEPPTQTTHSNSSSNTTTWQKAQAAAAEQQGSNR